MAGKASVSGASASIVSVIVVNYNGGDKLAKCLESLIADSYPHRQLLVVDNASTDGSLALLNDLATRFPEIAVILSARNLGYAGGVNLALPQATGEYVAILNMDVVVDQGWLKPLVLFLEQNEKAGAVNPLIALAEGGRINAAGQDVHVTGLGFNRWLGRHVTEVAGSPVSVSGIQGSAFVTRRAILDKIGGMDDDGFLYHEDVNFSWLLHMMGFNLYCVPASVVRHDYFLSMYPEKLYLLERNRWAMLVAYLHKPALLYLAPVLMLTEVFMWGYCLIRGWGFMRAKGRSFVWVLKRLKRIRKRSERVEALRVVSDWEVVRKIRWSYAWDQFFVLGRERGRSRRQNVSTLPEHAVDG